METPNANKTEKKGQPLKIQHTQHHYAFLSRLVFLFKCHVSGMQTVTYGKNETPDGHAPEPNTSPISCAMLNQAETVANSTVIYVTGGPFSQKGWQFLVPKWNHQTINQFANRDTMHPHRKETHRHPSIKHHQIEHSIRNALHKKKP